MWNKRHSQTCYNRMANETICQRGGEKHELCTAVFRWVHNTVCVDGRAPRGWLWLVVAVVVAVTLVWGWCGVRCWWVLWMVYIPRMYRVFVCKPAMLAGLVHSQGLVIRASRQQDSKYAYTHTHTFPHVKCTRFEEFVGAVVVRPMRRERKREIRGRFSCGEERTEPHGGVLRLSMVYSFTHRLY